MEYILGFVLLLGVLIFIHEFGHFIIAKACGVRVEAFSIGMGKKFVKFRRGETEYALSLLPLGGYVKLLGQDPREEVPPELESRSFRHKSLAKRAAIVLAGPVFNAALAVIVFIGLYSVGVPTQAPVLVRVLDGSPAAVAGFRSGDYVESIESTDGQSYRVRELSDLESIIGRSASHPLNIRVKRGTGESESRANITFTPVLGQERDSSLMVIKERGTIPGVEYAEPGPVLHVTGRSWAAARQLETGFWVEEVSFPQDGIEKSIPTESFAQLEGAWAQAYKAIGKLDASKITFKGRKVVFEGQPPEHAETRQLAWTLRNEAMPATLEAAGLASAELGIVEVKAESPAEKLGLKAGDRIVALGGQPVHSFTSFRTRLQHDATSGDPIVVAWVRDGKQMVASTRPELVSAEDPFTEAKKNQFQIGAKFMPTQAMPPRVDLKGDGPIDTIALGFRKTAELTKSMLENFYLLATGEISPKTLGGPILIGKIAGESFKAGPIAFFRMMAFISMNLCVLNLLPIPVLDGGHLVLYCIEAVRRRPLSLRIVEAWTTAGFFFLMGLIAIVFFNDLSRLGLFKFFNKG